MTTSKERYYNFIVDDVLKKTIVDYEERFYKFPFIDNGVRYNMDVMDLTIPITASTTNAYLFARFYIFMEMNYGVLPQEVVSVWNRYVNKIPK